MLNIISLQGNTNQNHNEIPVHTYEDGYGKKHTHTHTQTITSVGMAVAKLEPSYIAGGNVKWYSCSGKQFCSDSKC